MQSIRCLSLIASAVVMLATAGPAMAEDSDLSFVRAAWKAREERFPKFELMYSLEWTIPPKVYDSQDGTQKKADPHPDREVQTQHSTRVLFSGDRIRIDKSGEMYHTKERRVVPFASIAVFDGEKYIRYGSRGSAVDYFTATVKNDSELPESREAVMAPILLFARSDSMSKKFMPTSQYRLVRKDAPVQDILCWEFEFGEKGSNDNQLFWCDPNRNFAVVRQMDYSDARLRSQSDVWYSINNGEFVPMQWTSQAWSFNGQAGSKIKCTRTGFALNPAFTDADFDPKLPAKTYIVAESPDPKPATSPADEPNADPPAAEDSRFWIVGICCSIVGVLLAAIVLYRRRAKP